MKFALASVAAVFFLGGCDSPAGEKAVNLTAAQVTLVNTYCKSTAGKKSEAYEVSVARLFIDQAIAYQQTVKAEATKAKAAKKIDADRKAQDEIITNADATIKALGDAKVACNTETFKDVSAGTTRA